MDASQSVDQAGFRSGFSCADHLLAVTLLIEIFSEHRLPLWICTVDFEKAFDSIEHSFLWRSLVEQGVDIRYVRLLATFYQGQRGHVCGSAMSKAFQIGRGTKQGDPLSPVLFNAALEKVIEPLHKKWQAQGFGLPVENAAGRRLTNLRFADDILLMATTRRQVKIMIEDLIAAAAEAGLSIHCGKTKIMTNSSSSRGGMMKLEHGEVEVVPPAGSSAYLGKTMNLQSVHDVEIAARIDRAWKKFFASKTDLCGRHVNLKSRLKLFNATVTPTLLYGSGSWTMTADRERLLRTTQRRMLRWMLGAIWKRPLEEELQEESWESSSGSNSSHLESETEPNDETEKLQEESWIEWIQRCTHTVVRHLENATMDDWVVAQRRRKWRLAGHTARRTDHRWSETVLGWEPPYSHRPRGHPCKRWESDLDAFFFEREGAPRWVWQTAAKDREKWQELEKEFVARAWYR